MWIIHGKSFTLSIKINYNLMETKPQHVCPWWIGYALINPFRKYYHNPDYILKPYVQPGMKAVDFGCAMGYFTLPMARMVGESGRIYAVDIQQKMINSLTKRASKAQLNNIIQPILMNGHPVPGELTGNIDFVMLFAVVHEVPSQEELFSNLANMVKPGGKVLFAEPMGHVSLNAFEKSIALSEQCGFELVQKISIKGSRAVVLQKR
jgi:2-polyprenyl-3-methyl-5-hydroxy-6-metoxy-1,4-benzoquinol methylase